MNTTTELKIEGMTCGHCVRGVTQALQGVSGVQHAEVSLQEGNAIVTHDGSATLDALRAAVEEEGYRATGA